MPGRFTLLNEVALDQAASALLGFAGHSEALGLLATLMQPGQILVDTTVPMSRSHPRGLRPLTPFAGSAAQEARDLLPDSIHVVSALHTVSAAMLDNLDHPLDEDVLVELWRNTTFQEFTLGNELQCGATGYASQNRTPHHVN